MQISGDVLETLRLKLRYKARYHLGGYCPDVEDVVQETLSRVLAAARDGRIRNAESLGAFASATCQNVIHEYRRGLWREMPFEAGPTDPVAPADNSLELQDLVARTIAELPERDRALLIAFYLEENAPEEICRDWGLNEGSLRVALFRARERFRKISGATLKSSAPGTH
ncbi:MAG: RNA polymerase sigma factor [Acidobacteria bacterium]|nr:RNA polymerase sigma factor [Acidobacteriota bacterium]